MDDRSRAASAVVVGGGVIGLSIAWRLAVGGWSVTVVDPAPARGASWFAGGMLAPLTETWPGEEALLAVGTDGVRRWPGFAAELGIDLRTDGTVVVAADAADAAQLDTLAGHLAELGRSVDRLSGHRLREVEPAVGPRARSGLLVPGDLAVDNRELLARLANAAAGVGVTFVRAPATRVSAGRVRVGPRSGAGDERQLACDLVVVASGAWSGTVCPALSGLVRPVKGEILRLRRRRTATPPPRHTVRALVESRPVYLVPRSGDELVVGATQYDAGFDDEVTVAGVRDLLADAEAVVPGVAEYELAECAAGLRAGSRDNLPLIGWVEPGVLVAAGHHRNGLLLAPLTADAVLAMASGTEPPDSIAATAPTRFGFAGLQDGQTLSAAVANHGKPSADQ